MILLRASLSRTSLTVASMLLAGSSLFSSAAKIPTNLNDNVLTCGANAQCSNKVMFGRNYKVIQTAKFTVMVSVSNEGQYTRADVSIENHADYTQNVSPQDFRVEVISPKPKVPKILLYVPPSELQLPPAPMVAAAANLAAVQAPAGAGGASAAVPATPNAAVPATPNIDELYEAAKREQAAKEAAEKEAAQKHLVAAPIPANEVVRGRVYFEKDPKAKQVNVVIPVAGLVFEFPYAMKF
jgi:hypothetical protein